MRDGKGAGREGKRLRRVGDVGRGVCAAVGKGRWTNGWGAEEVYAGGVARSWLGAAELRGVVGWSFGRGGASRLRFSAWDDMSGAGVVAMVVRSMLGEDEMQVAMLTERGVMGNECVEVCGCVSDGADRWR